jgi:MYXO-CTERM domain-containing protein
LPANSIVCDEAGQCVPSEEVKNETSGTCSVSVPGQTDSSSREHVLLALAAASILAARRKRAKA